MTITKNVADSKAILKLEGRLDTMTAPDLEKTVKALIGDVTEMEMDFSDLAYCSSAGLRVLLSAYKALTAKGGSLVIKNPTEAVRDVFEVTGLTDILTIA